MDLHQLPPSPSPGLVNLIVEIPAGSRNKYEYSAEAGVMVLDRVMHSSVRYPFDYGFIPNTPASAEYSYLFLLPAGISTMRFTKPGEGDGGS